MYPIQVDKEQYSFRKYVHKRRWLSIWHQIDEVLSTKALSVLEIGPGPGLLKVLAGHYGVTVKTVDLDPDLMPDYVASVTDLPFDDNIYDCVCAFQMLEHLPYEQALQGFDEMVRVAKNYVIISLPDAKKIIWTFSLNIPGIGEKIIHIPKPRIRKKVHRFKGQHYWGINKRGFSLKKIIDDFNRKDILLQETYRVKEYPWHRFFVFKKINV